MVVIAPPPTTQRTWDLLIVSVGLRVQMTFVLVTHSLESWHQRVRFVLRHVVYLNWCQPRLLLDVSSHELHTPKKTQGATMDLLWSIQAPNKATRSKHVAARYSGEHCRASSDAPSTAIATYAHRSIIPISQARKLCDIGLCIYHLQGTPRRVTGCLANGLTYQLPDLGLR